MVHAIRFALFAVIGAVLAFVLTVLMYESYGIPKPGILNAEQTECQLDIPRSQTCVARVYWEVK